MPDDLPTPKEMTEFQARAEATVKFLGAWSMMIPPEERDGWWFELRNLAEAHARKALD
jgi:hypothetical protein